MLPPTYIRTWSQSDTYHRYPNRFRGDHHDKAVGRASSWISIRFIWTECGDTHRYSCGNCVRAFTAALLSHSGERVGHPRVKLEQKGSRSVWPGRSGGRRSSSRSFSGSAMVGTRGGGAAAASGGDRGSSTSRANSSSSSRQPSADEKGVDDDGQVSHDDVVELLNCMLQLSE